jgi:hypothetical protein
MRSFTVRVATALVCAVTVHATLRAQDSSSATHLDPAAYGAFENGSNAPATTEAWIACIRDAIARKKSIRFKGDHLVETNRLVIDGPLVIEGSGVRVSRLLTRGTGALLTQDCRLEQSTGKGITLRDFGLFTDNKITAPGSVGVLLTNTGNANNAFSWLSNLVVSGFHDGIIVRNQYFYTVTDCYIDRYRRYGIQLMNTWTYDAGDGIISGCWIQPLQAANGTGFDEKGANIRVEQASGTRIVGNKIFPGHRVGVHFHAGGTSTEQVPSGMLMIAMNQFDSFGANKDAIVIDSDWRRQDDDVSGTSGTPGWTRDGAAPTLTGHRIGNVQITGNNLSNVGRLLTIRTLPGGLQKVSVTGNTSIGGGGIRVMGSVDGLWIDGNIFDNRAVGGGAGSGFADRKPIYVEGTAPNSSAGTNRYIGFAEAADIPDVTDRGMLDATPSTAQIQVHEGRAVVTADPNNVRQSHEILALGSVSIAFRGVADGDEGVFLVRQAGDGNHVSFADAPQGYQYVWEEGSSGTFATSDRHLDMVRWEIRGRYIILRIIRLGKISEAEAPNPQDPHGVRPREGDSGIGEQQRTPYLSNRSDARALPPSLNPSSDVRLLQDDCRIRTHRVEGAGLPLHRNGNPG